MKKQLAALENALKLLVETSDELDEAPNKNCLREWAAWRDAICHARGVLGCITAKRRKIKSRYATTQRN